MANWKANKNFAEVREWIYTFQREYRPHENVLVGIFPPFPFLSYVQGKLKDCHNVFIGSQTISSFEKGSYTGEVTATTLEGIVSHTIIGHSERRNTFKETDEDLAKKTEQALAHKITPVFCIQNESTSIPRGVKIIAYEPVGAIGTGMNQPAEETVEVKRKIKLPSDSIFVYGGSVTAENAMSYFDTKEIDGFLIGKACLDPHSFLKIVVVAQESR